MGRELLVVSKFLSTDDATIHSGRILSGRAKSALLPAAHLGGGVDRMVEYGDGRPSPKPEINIFEGWDPRLEPGPPVESRSVSTLPIRPLRGIYIAAATGRTVGRTDHGL